MNYREIILLFFLGLAINSCGLTLNAPDDGGGGIEPDTTAIFQKVSSSHLPDGLTGTTHKTKTVDIDNDNDLDLVLALQFQPNKILINDGEAHFSDQPSSLPNSQKYDSRDIAIADFNNDGYFDLFFAGNQNNTDEFYINDKKSNFSDLTNRIPVTGSSFCTTVADFDNDGAIDIMVGNTGQNILLMNNGNASFTNQTTQRIPSLLDATRDITVADFTGDNLLDIVIANEDANRILINSGAGSFTDQTQSRIPFIQAVEETRDINYADIDGDGDFDLYFGNSGLREGTNSQDRLLINNGKGFFADQTANRLPTITSNTFDAEFADLDGDGDFDLIAGNYNGGIRVLLNNGDGFFTDSSSDWIPADYFPLVTDIEIGDYNADGLFDVYLAVRNGTDQLLLQQKL